MKKMNITRLAFSGLLISGIFAINSCKKETVAKPEPVSKTVVEATDSSNYLKGYFDGEVVKFEGNASAYSAYVDPDSATQTGSSGQHRDHDNDAFYQSGSKWMMLTNAGIQTVNASVEIRSLAVRVFVSPVASVSTTFYNLINPQTYPIATDLNTSQGAYITLRDSKGTLWTSDGDQDGSALVISNRGANMNTYTIVSGTIVSCKLYDDAGNMKKLTNATFTAALGI